MRPQVHLGVVGWQYCYTGAGCDPITRQWMRLYCPERLAANDENAREVEAAEKAEREAEAEGLAVAA